MRRKAVLLFTTMVAALLLAGGTALALNKVCTTDPCDGTTKADLLIGTANGETINGLAGNDLIIGGEGGDTFNDPAVSNAGAGSDTYSFTDGFGLDTLNDTGSASDRDTVDFSKVSKFMEIFAVPGFGSQNNRASDFESTVTFGSTTPPFTTIEKIVGPAGPSLIFGGQQTNTYVLSVGGGGTVVDFGGQLDPDGNPVPGLPPSNDTYTGYKSGKQNIGDHGGSGDVLDLRPRRATDVYFWKVDDGGNPDLELIFSPPDSSLTSPDKITIEDYFTTRFKIEKIVFADRTITPIGPTVAE